MSLQIIVDVFSGRPNPVVELHEKEAQAVLSRLSPGEATPRGENEKEPGSLLGYRGLIIEQKGPINKKFARIFRVYDGTIFGPANPRRVSDPTFEVEFLGSTGPIAKQKLVRSFKQSGLFEFRGDRGKDASTPKTKLPGDKANARSRKPRPCKCAPGYEPLWWNNAGTGHKQYENNCYNYATNYRTDTFGQPGRAAGTTYQVLGPALWGQALAAGALQAAGAMYKALTCPEVLKAAILDDLVLSPTQENECPEEGHLVALVIAPGYDFHWYRRGRDGYWTHKPGGTPVTNVDNSGVVIVDPRTANRGPYTDFCKFLVVHHGHVKVL